MCQTQGNRCDSLSSAGGLHGLSFDPADTHALLSAVNTLPSTKEPQRCCPPVRTSSSDSPCQEQSHSCSSSASSDCLANCPEQEGSLPSTEQREGSLPSTERVQQDSNGPSHTTTSSSQETRSPPQAMSIVVQEEGQWWAFQGSVPRLRASSRRKAWRNRKG